MSCFLNHKYIAVGKLLREDTESIIKLPYDYIQENTDFININIIHHQ